jgi:AraC-like DNA-binding protein
VESFCVFFGPRLARGVLRDLTAVPERLLDDPWRPGEAVQVVERTYPHDDVISPALRLLHGRMSQGPPVEEGSLGEALHDLLARLIRAQGMLRGEVAALSAVRAATREEIYRRVALARDYARALFDQAVTLDDMARVACLSPNHLLRCFKEAFGQTPHQFLIDTRLQRAQELLACTDLPVTEVCLAVGFHSLGSFSWLFRRRTGLSPQDYRRSR